MKLAIFSVLTMSAAAFTAPSMTFAVGKKGAAKTKAVGAAKTKAVKAAKTKAVVSKKKAPVQIKSVSTYSGGTIPSTALPFENAPDTLDGSLPGDVGFDPCFLSTKADLMATYYNRIVETDGISGLTWYREAELMHGRIAMLAVVGFIVPGFYTFPGDEQVGLDAFSYTNPLEAPSHIPAQGWLQIALFAIGLEFRRIDLIQTAGNDYIAGDFKWGQFGWNPFGFNYTPDQFADKQLQETKHGRLAMIALLGLYFQASVSGVNVIDQLSPAFDVPEYYGKAGYFLPQGI
jgi:hypothetical protein